MAVKFNWPKANRRTAVYTWRARQPDQVWAGRLPTPAAMHFRACDTVTQVDVDTALHQAVSSLNCTGALEALGLHANVHSTVKGMTLKHRIGERKQRMKPREGLIGLVRDREEEAMKQMLRILAQYGARL